MAASLIGETDELRTPQDDTTLGRNVAKVFDLCRRSTIRGGAWNFATRRASLAAVADPGEIYPWGYAFQMPADSLKLREVLGYKRADYQLEGDKRILCNTLGPLYIRYLFDVPEPANWDDLFADAFAARIAFQIGPVLAGGAYDKATGWKIFQSALSVAKGEDANENPPQESDWTGWELARFGGGLIPAPRF